MIRKPSGLFTIFTRVVDVKITLYTLAGDSDVVAGVKDGVDFEVIRNFGLWSSVVAKLNAIRNHDFCDRSDVDVRDGKLVREIGKYDLSKKNRN